MTILTTAVPIFSITVPIESMIGPICARTSLKALMISGSLETVVSTIFVISGMYGAMAATILVIASPMLLTMSLKAEMMLGSCFVVSVTIFVMSGI